MSLEDKGRRGPPLLEDPHMRTFVLFIIAIALFNGASVDEIARFLLIIA
jgi:hypothetical protein